MDNIQAFPGFTIEHPLIPSPHDPEAQTRAAARARAIASRIADIHLLAMDSNPLLHAQFPTPESLAAVREFLVGSYEEAIVENSRSGADGANGILVARETTPAHAQPRPGSALREEDAAAAEQHDGAEKKIGDIIGLATWEYTPGSSPSASSSAGTEPLSVSESANSANSASPASTATTHDPNSSGGNIKNLKDSNKLETSISQHVAGCQSHYLDEYARLATQARAKYFVGGGGSGKECYQLSFVCIDPVYQGKGVGSALTRKVLDLAAVGSPMPGGTRKGLPVYLESTLPAVRMYQRLGFKEIGSFEMEIPTRTGGSGEDKEGEGIHPIGAPLSGTTIYKEICMVWYP